MAPFTALLLALAALPAAAADCIHRTPGSKAYAKDLETVISCQKQSLADLERKKGKLSDAQREKLEDRHRVEVKRYIESSGYTVEGGSPSDSENVAVDEDSDDAGKEQEDFKKPKLKDKLGGLSPQDLARAGKGAGDIKDLEARLKGAAGDGSNGITPSMARDIIDTLQAKQGGVSSDMKELLDSVVKDGGKLTPETMKKLQGAAKSAKGAGMELGIDPNMEKAILNSDFDQDTKDKARTPPASPDSM